MMHVDIDVIVGNWKASGDERLIKLADRVPDRFQMTDPAQRERVLNIMRPAAEMVIREAKKAATGSIFDRSGAGDSSAVFGSSNAVGGITWNQ
jgi:hypothetical protein